MATLTNGTETIEATGAGAWVGIVNAAIQVLDALRGSVGTGFDTDESGVDLVGTIDGANTTFTVSNAAYTELWVYANGLIQPPSVITKTTPASGIFDFVTAPLANTKIVVIYTKP